MAIDGHKIIWIAVAVYLTYFLIKLLSIQVTYIRKRKAIRDNLDRPSTQVDFDSLERDAKRALRADELEETLNTIDQLKELQRSTNEQMKRSNASAHSASRVALLMITGTLTGLAYSLYQVFGD